MNCAIAALHYPAENFNFTPKTWQHITTSRHFPTRWIEKGMAAQYWRIGTPILDDGYNRRQLLCDAFKRKIVGGPLDCFQTLEDVREGYLHPIGTFLFKLAAYGNKLCLLCLWQFLVDYFGLRGMIFSANISLLLDSSFFSIQFGPTNLLFHCNIRWLQYKKTCY